MNSTVDWWLMAHVRAEGAIADGDSVLIPATGSGLKDPPQLSP